MSDVHLCADRPAQRDRFLKFLETPVNGATELFILGDLFEYWIGDDDLDDPFNQEIAAALKRVSEHGTRVYFIHGNRDFLIGERFAKETEITVLPDPVVMTIQDVPTLLMHGDLLCTEDVGYLAFRKQVRDPAWQAQFLAQPRAVRHQIAQNATQESALAKSGKTMAIMDATPEAVENAFVAHHVTRMVHGHTHRPAHHPYPHLKADRYVLPDWYETGGYLVLSDGEFEDVRFTLT